MYTLLRNVRETWYYDGIVIELTYRASLKALKLASAVDVRFLSFSNRIRCNKTKLTNRVTRDVSTHIVPYLTLNSWLFAQRNKLRLQHAEVQAKKVYHCVVFIGRSFVLFIADIRVQHADYRKKNRKTTLSTRRCTLWARWARKMGSTQPHHKLHVMLKWLARLCR